MDFPRKYFGLDFDKNSTNHRNNVVLSLENYNCYCFQNICLPTLFLLLNKLMRYCVLQICCYRTKTYTISILVEQFNYNKNDTLLVLAPIWELPPGGVFACMGLGFCLSFLFFLDQNITSAIVNNQQNK